MRRPHRITELSRVSGRRFGPEMTDGQLHSWRSLPEKPACVRSALSTTPKRPLGWGRKNSGAVRRFFPKTRGFAAQDIHCQAGALRRAATVRVPLDGVRWTEAPRGRPCPRQGARAGARTAPPRRAPADPGCSGGLARIAAAGVRLPTVPPRNRRAVPASPGGPPGSLSPPSPPPWPYRSRNLSEFPVSPHLGREPSSRRSSGNTPGLQRFSRNKETGRQLCPCSPKENAHPCSPAPGRRRPVVQQPTVAEAPTPRHPLLRPVSQRLEAKGARAARSQRGGRGASERRTKGSQEGRSLQPHRGPFARPSPESPAGVKDAPAARTPRTPGLPSSRCHPARGALDLSSGAQTFLLRPGPARQTRTENRPRARLTRGAPWPGALRLLPSSSAASASPSSLVFLGPARSPRRSPALA
ncbi:nascent polypeptide-associated complex subunit alpha, muscle-specific form-like [Mustela erminea]|uniref:nascent polypeptide-associated complex subunit alpha, muscle-specific form-like n=1 Tax=Mustela erminea TaxID=36723 RepID=UPI001386F9E5|nr:nascent polypeptide-associated complex subunit alpha, muscle-specific form-like [Mustela erminea]